MAARTNKQTSTDVSTVDVVDAQIVEDNAPAVRTVSQEQPERALSSVVIEVMPSTMDDDLMRSIESFSDVYRLAHEADTGIIDASDVMGNGFALLRNKDRLIGQELVFLEWRFQQGDFGTPYVTAYVVSRDPLTGAFGKWVVNDGSTGIAEQLAKVTKDTGVTRLLSAKHGLRKSEYDTDQDGKPTADKTLAAGRGATYYIDTSA